MIVATHGPETCPAARKGIRDAYLPELSRIAEIGRQRDVDVEGGWSDMPGHKIFIVVDAPNAHAVTEFVSDLRLMDWNTVVVHPVVPLEQAVSRVGAREARA